MAENFGLTWWGQRWIAALEALGRAYANRLPRGRTYARGGAVTDLFIGAGRVTARVAGRRPTPYRVSLDLPVFTDPQWTAAAHALARQLRHSAALLDGRMPEDIDETLDAAGLPMASASSAVVALPRSRNATSSGSSWSLCCANRQARVVAAATVSSSSASESNPGGGPSRRSTAVGSRVS